MPRIEVENIKSNKDDPILIDDNTEINEGETSYDVPLNFSSKPDEDNLPIAKRRLFERVLKGKGKAIQTENEEDKIKMAKIYFLENFLLGKQFTIGIDLEYIKLLDDEKQFDEYPWGRIVYECIPLFTGLSIFCAQRIEHKKICMLIWVVDSHPKCKDSTMNSSNIRPCFLRMTSRNEARSVKCKVERKLMKILRKENAHDKLSNPMRKFLNTSSNFKN
ncbi:uncharacterized protein E5676_scaffold606G00970 [Cucumis melo var. makuwa]|uniref:DUF1985 domain-containing protein n=1 Tax=Cucumis melo var. makuwa TaxID=1194695 RepID=A0A5A7UTR0_CUCMM|nr:uncharacterized protein E6C27_scaffold132G001350 [Cucumis melo var. makuwa]TYK07210.1 uncharacterized protein E5676_scaffold606G00970 [Cucumis melo var. makuwa]